MKSVAQSCLVRSERERRKGKNGPACTADRAGIKRSFQGVSESVAFSVTLLQKESPFFKKKKIICATC